MSELEKRVASIEERNARVELDKGWEISAARKIIILVTTYILIAIYMTFIGVTDPWLNAIIPSLGFLISTMTLQWAKNIWLKSQNK